MAAALGSELLPKARGVWGFGGLDAGRNDVAAELGEVDGLQVCVYGLGYPQYSEKLPRACGCL